MSFDLGTTVGLKTMVPSPSGFPIVANLEGSIHANNNWSLIDITAFETQPKKAWLNVSSGELIRAYVIPDELTWSEVEGITSPQTGWTFVNTKDDWYPGEDESPSRWKNGDLCWIVQREDNFWVPVEWNNLRFVQGACKQIPYLPFDEIPYEEEGPFQELGYKGGCLVRHPPSSEGPEGPEEPLEPD